MAVILLDRPVGLPVTVLRTLLSRHFPDVVWRVGEEDSGGKSDAAGLDRPQTVMGRTGDGAMVLIAISRADALYRPANGHQPPPHRLHLNISRPSTSDDALARRIALIIAAGIVVDQDERARLQLAPGETWLDTSDIRALLRAMADDPDLITRNHHGTPERFGDSAEAAPAPPPPPPEDKPRAPQLGSFSLLLDGEVHIDWPAIERGMNMIDPEGKWTIVAAPGGLGFAMGRSKMVMIWSPMPFDGAEIANNLARSFWFDGDRARVARHRQYITVLIDAPEDYAARAATAKAATLLVGMIALNRQVCAVINNMVGTIFSPAMTKAQVGILHSDEIPIQLWTWTAPNSLADGDVSLTTGGLEPFLGYEVEVWNAPHAVATVAERLNGVLCYLLINGPVIQHGETIGTSRDDQSTRCFFGPSRGQRPTPVKAMFVEFDGDGPATPKKDLPLPPVLRATAPALRRAGGFGRKGL